MLAMYTELLRNVYGSRHARVLRLGPKACLFVDSNLQVFGFGLKFAEAQGVGTDSRVPAKNAMRKSCWVPLVYSIRQ